MNSSEQKKEKIKLSPEQEKEFTKRLKIGMLKQLHNARLLTDRQLSQLILMQN